MTNPETILLNANNHLCQTWQPYSGTIERQNLCDACDILRDARKRVIAEAMDAAHGTIATDEEIAESAATMTSNQRAEIDALPSSDDFQAWIEDGLRADPYKQYDVFGWQPPQGYFTCPNASTILHAFIDNGRNVCKQCGHKQ